VSTETPQGWTELVDKLEKWMPPVWIRNARDFGAQPWIRLILLVDAHAALCAQQSTEKISMTMADLAGDDHEKEREGWEAIAEAARTERLGVVVEIVDRGESLLPPELVQFFSRSIEPLSHMYAS
jgi:hypothetical protein